MADFARARRAMVEGQLRTSGVLDARILTAMGRVPREIFVPEARRALAYLDEEIPVSPTRKLPEPAGFGRLVQLAEIGSGDVVLDVACGTGYSTAVLSALANGVVALEDDPALVEAANANLAAIDIGNAAVVEGPLAGGIPREAPFDVIVIEGAVDAVPQDLLDQLRDGGRLVAAIGHGNAGVAHLFVRSGDAIAQSSHFNLSLPALAVFARPEGFRF